MTKSGRHGKTTLNQVPLSPYCWHTCRPTMHVAGAETRDICIPKEQARLNGQRGGHPGSQIQGWQGASHGACWHWVRSSRLGPDISAFHPATFLLTPQTHNFVCTSESPVE